MGKVRLLWDSKRLRSMISVIICTRNRSQSLKRTLESIRQLSCPVDVSWEVVVVDNNSSDDTKAVIDSVGETSGLDVHYVFEPNRGISNARNAGLRHARGEVIAFTDDDMILDSAWLLHIAEEVSKETTIPVFFGQTHTMRPGQARIAIKEGDADETYVFPCDPNAPGSSNNMMFRSSLLSSIGYFDTTLGAGTTIGNSEDTDFNYRIFRSGAMIRYCPRILAYHDHDRLSPSAVRSIVFVYGRGRGGFYCKHILRRDIWAMKLCFWDIKAFLRVVFKPGKLIPVFLYLTGMFIGFWLRLGIEAQALAAGTFHTPGLDKDCL